MLLRDRTALGPLRPGTQPPAPVPRLLVPVRFVRLRAPGRSARGRGRDGQACGRVRAASAQVQAPRARDVYDVARGETAGASFVLENVTVQAGDRDLFEVSGVARNELVAAFVTQSALAVACSAAQPVSVR